MSCERTRELFSDYFDAALAPPERREVETHLEGCPACRSEYAHYTNSLQALHETGFLETTQVFLSNVRAAADACFERDELYSRTGLEVPPEEAPPPVDRRGLPAWVPFSLAAVTILAFGLGYYVQGRGKERDLAGIRRAIEKGAAERKAANAAPSPERADAQKVLQEQGLVRVEGQWIPKSMKEAFDEGRVCMGGRMMSRKEAAERLAGELPPPAAPVAPAPAPVPTVEEILDRSGYTLAGALPVPKAWVGRWAEGYVQVGVNEWKKSSDFKEEFMRENGLVDVDGRLMSREQAGELQAQQTLRRPDAASADNELTRALEGLKIGPSLGFGGLTIYPLRAAAPGGEPGLLTLHSALGEGKLELSDTGSVFTVQAKNPLDSAVLLLAGEVLAGGRCARMVARDTIVPARQTVSLPVFCAEPGVWKAGDRFAQESGHFLAPPVFLGALAAEEGQGAVWSLLAARLDKGRAGLADLFRKNGEAISDYRSCFTELPGREPAAVGIAVAEGGALEFVEIFQGHALFAACFDRLVAAAALDVLEYPADAGTRPPAEYPNSVAGVKRFLEGAFLLSYEQRENGYAIRRGKEWVGRVCVSGGGLLHAVVHAGGASAWERRATYTIPGEKVKKILGEFEARMKAAGTAGKIAAFKEMASIGVPEVVPALVKHLGGSDKAVQGAAARELGLRGDPRALEGLSALASRSRRDPAVYSEAIRAVARLGDERAADLLLQHVEGGEAETARAAVQAYPEFMVRLRNRDVLERFTGRLVSILEAAEAAAGGVVVDPAVRGLRPGEAQLLAEAAREALRQGTGHDARNAAEYRLWWNSRENRERFLKDRTGR